MSWEHRGSHIYYYHKFRLSGELVCRYIVLDNTPKNSLVSANN